ARRSLATRRIVWVCRLLPNREISSGTEHIVVHSGKDLREDSNHLSVNATRQPATAGRRQRRNLDRPVRQDRPGGCRGTACTLLLLVSRISRPVRSGSSR